MKLGFVTYQIGKDWDVPTLIQMCQNTGFQGVELRTTHAHGVEVDLSADQRKEVRKQFDDAGVEIAGLGSTFEFHAVEEDVVRQNIDGTIACAKLAADLGCSGVKVRPNGVQTDNGIAEEKTFEQIGLSLRECGEAAGEVGVEIRLEVHGRPTNDPVRVRKIMDYADHGNVHVCLNSGQSEVENGSVKQAYDLLKDKIGLVHINELWKPEFPWQELFGLLKADGYSGYTLAEIPACSSDDDAERLLRYYKTLWEALQN